VLPQARNRSVLNRNYWIEAPSGHFILNPNDLTPILKPHPDFSHSDLSAGLTLDTCSTLIKEALTRRTVVSTVFGDSLARLSSVP